MIRFVIKNKLKFSIVPLVGLLLIAACSERKKESAAWTKAATVGGTNREFGEPFGLAVRDDVLYVSDGERGKILRVAKNGNVETVTDKLDTPSAIAFDKDGFLVVADAGSHTIKKVNVSTGEISIVAGIENKKGYADGEANQAMFNAPIGVAVSENKIYVADSYNDKIRVVENGKVSTYAGSVQGFADAENGLNAKFDTPCAVAAAPDGGLIVADTGSKRVRLIEPNGKTTTIAGNDESASVDGLLNEARFVQPTAIAVDRFGAIYVADGNSIRAIGRRIFPFVETVTNTKRGFSDGALSESKFNRPSGLAFDASGNLFVADSENQTVRVLTGEDLGAAMTVEQIKKIQLTPEEFRALQPARWTYNPPEVRRDVAGTLGEIRGEIADGKNAWFHNGLDVAGSYGETARFVRAEKILLPVAAEGFGNLRERLRMPTLGYIHIRLGRDSSEKPFDDARFQFSRDENAKLNGVRVPRGARFAAGEAIGTLNSFNHIHLIAGRTGAEMNALDALVFPNISDKIAPVIEKVALYDENWRQIETGDARARIKLNGRTRVVARAFDRMDGNAAYRKLGVYRLGYQILKSDDAPVGEAKQTISFARMPDESAARFVYAPGSQSGYAPQTVFDYIVTNEVGGDVHREDFFDAGVIDAGNYKLKVFAADFFGNVTEKIVEFEAVK